MERLCGGGGKEDDDDDEDDCRVYRIECKFFPLI